VLSGIWDGRDVWPPIKSPTQKSLGSPQACTVDVSVSSFGYTGGLLSLVMQHQPIMESPHFWTGSAVVVLLAFGSLISLTGFGGGKQSIDFRF
jgi:hypothetical protein